MNTPLPSPSISRQRARCGGFVKGARRGLRRLGTLALPLTNLEQRLPLLIGGEGKHQLSDQVLTITLRAFQNPSASVQSTRRTTPSTLVLRTSYLVLFERPSASVQFTPKSSPSTL